MDNGYIFLYTEINIFCVLLSVIVYLRSGGFMRLTSSRVFRGSIISMIVFMVSDNIAYAIVSGAIPFSVPMLLLFKSIYFLATTAMCCFWHMYFECMRDTNFWNHQIHLVLLSIPLGAQFFLEIINGKTGIFFYADGQGYHRGPWFVWQFILAYGYIVTAIIRTIAAGIREKNYLDRGRIVVWALFPIMPACSGVLQYFFPSLPLACVASTLVLLILYFNLTDGMISLDPLTNLSNRRILLYNLSKKMREQGENDILYLFMIDANLFKGINDTYGHLEGDKALVRISDALKQACEKIGKRPVIARFGGDEFVIVGNFSSDEEAERLCEEIHDRLKELNEQAAAPYDLTVSIGTARYDSRFRSVRDFMTKADESLYEKKRKRGR